VRVKELKSKLDKYYHIHIKRAERGNYEGDPLLIVDRFRTHPFETEIVAFLVSCFSYGSRKVFVPLMRKRIYAISNGLRPFLALKKASDTQLTIWAKDFKYRFHNSAHYGGLLKFVRNITLQYGTLGNYFCSKWEPRDPDPLLKMLDRVSEDFLNSPRLDSPYGTMRYLKGSKFLIPAPSNGSTCKRMLMFLRWMIRKDTPDFGLWQWVKPKDLIIPVDVHLLRTAKKFGLTSTNAHANIDTAIQITKALKLLDPKDPVKYDYALYLSDTY
jgi:uncharacterized protein (TIGR02757 family)